MPASPTVPTPATPPVSAGGDGQATPPPEVRPRVSPPQLPPHTSRFGRIAEHAAGMADDIKAMAKLRAKLVQLEAKGKVQAKQNEVQARAQAYGEAYVPTGILILAGAILLLVAFGFLFSASVWSLFGISILWSLTIGFTVACLLLVAAGAIWYRAHTPIRIPVDVTQTS